MIILEEEVKSPAPKKKAVEYKVPAEVLKMIKEDEVNKKLWDEALESTKEGPQVWVC